MPSLSSARSLALALLAAAALAAGGCRSGARSDDGGGAAAPAGPLPTVANVMPGDVLHGRLPGPTSCQTFSFDGVEYSLLDLDIWSETEGKEAPRLQIADPDGRPFDMASMLEPASGPLRGVKGVVLRKSGSYRVTVCAAGGCAGETAYAFQHDLRMSLPEDRTFDLTPCKKDALSFVAAKGSRCVVSLLPANSCGVRARIVSVKDPSNGRALAPDKQLCGADDPRVDSGRGNEARLDFIAPRAGLYTVVLTAEEGTCGKATAHVSVRPPEKRCLDLYYDGAPATCPTSTKTVAKR